MDFVQDWIVACVLRDVTIGLLRCITGCGCWIVTFVLQDVHLACCYLCIAVCIRWRVTSVVCDLAIGLLFIITECSRWLQNA